MDPCTRRGYGQRSDLLVILMLAAMVCVMGSGHVYLGERVLCQSKR
jgi:hypothetical protein